MVPLDSKIERCIAQRTLHSHKGETNGILKFKTGDHIHAYGIYDRKNKKILPFNRDRHHHIIEDGESACEFWYGALVDKKVDLPHPEGPIKAVTSFFLISRFTLNKACFDA